jgi:hypothetical protein
MQTIMSLDGNIKLKLEDCGIATATLSFFNLTDASFEEEFLSKKYLIKLVFFSTGIFMVGYFSQRKESK